MKKVFMFAVVASMLAATSCGEKKEEKKDGDKAEQAEGEEAEEAEAEEVEAEEVEAEEVEAETEVDAEATTEEVAE